MTTRLTELAVSTTGNIIGGNVVANVVLTNNFQYANGQPFSGNVNYSNANVAAFLPTYTGDLSANNVTVGTVYSPNFYGNAVTYTNATGYLASTNLFKYNPGTETLTVGSASLTGNITADYFIGDGSQLTNLPSGSGNTGNVTFDNQVIQGTGDQYGGGGLYLAPGTDSTGNLQYLRVRGGDYPTHIHFDTGNTAYYDQYFGDDNKYVKLEAGYSGNIVIGTNSLNWIFGEDTTFKGPLVNTARGDVSSGNIYGYTLNLTDGVQEAVITTANGDADGNPNSQRLVINPGAGADTTAGEGGDIYLWAGRGGDVNGNGGDVKVRGGYGPGNGQGGYIRIEAGDVGNVGTPGYVYLRGGDANFGSGGYVTLQGGYGGDGSGGAINIQGGDSGNGDLYDGNVNIQTGSHTWTFDNTGNVTLPANCVIRTPIGSNGNIVLKPSNSGLVVIKGGTSPLLLIQSDVANTQNRIEIDNFGSANNIGGTFVGRYSRGTLSAPAAVQAGDQLAAFKGKGYDGSAFSNPVAQISVEAFDNWALGNVPSRLSFYTTGYNDGSNPILNMTISPTGNVDILNGNLIVSGGGGYLQGNTVTGNDGLYAGSANFTPLGSNVVAQFGANSNSYSQINFQNINDGSLASTDYILTANNGDDTTYFVDLGITSNNHSDSAFFGDTSTANDAYLYVVASAATGPSGTGTGNLILGSTNGNIKMFVGNTAQANVVQTISSTGVDIVGNVVADNVLVTASIGVSGVASPAPTISGFSSINSVNFSATGNVTANGYVSVTGNVTGGNIVTSGSGGNIILTGGNITGAHIVVTTPTALANLTAVAGGRAFINNANLVAAGNFGNQVGSGGSNVVPVWSDGSNWYVG